MPNTPPARTWARLEWMVLDWNQRAIDFYETLGAEASDWVSYRVEAHQLQQLANA
ncbi:MAG: hypothetical protein R2857_08755 [Vampirovibrionales bacterium]